MANSILYSTIGVCVHVTHTLTDTQTYTLIFIEFLEKLASTDGSDLTGDRGRKELFLVVFPQFGVKKKKKSMHL